MKNFLGFGNLKAKLFEYSIPQLLCSVIISVLYIPVVNYILKPLLEIAYNYFRWDILNNKYRDSFTVLVFPLLGLILLYFAFGKKTVRIYAPGRSAQKFCFGILPGLVGFIACAFLYSHFNKLKIINLVIDNVDEIRAIPDRIEVYHIKHYEINYDNYFYTVELNRVRRGVKTNRSNVTEMTTSIICPLIIGDTMKDSTSKKEVWLGFRFIKEFNCEFDRDFPTINETKKDHLALFQDKKPVTYFKELNDETYNYLLFSAFDKDSSLIKNSTILEAHHDYYVPYNGYENLLIGIYILAGGNFFVFLITLFVATN